MAKRSKDSQRKPARKARTAKVRSFSAEDFRHKAFTLADQVKALNEFMTIAQISRETMIPASTLRRYRDGGKPRSDVGELYAGILASGFQVIHKEVVRERARSRTVKGVGRGKRITRRDPKDPSKRIASDSIDYNIMNSSDGAILAVMYRAAERARLLGIPGFVRFLILADETDPQYPGEYFWTEPEALAELTKEEIADVLAEARARGTLILMRIQDRGE